MTEPTTPAEENVAKASRAAQIDRALRGVESRMGTIRQRPTDVQDERDMLEELRQMIATREEI
jgi:hypothetical protein